MNSNWQELKREFQQRREEAVAARDERKSLIYDQIPEIRKIDKQIIDMGIAFGRKLVRLASDTKSTKEFEQEINGLIERKRELLRDNGYPENYLDIIYSCKDCNDTGFITDDEGKPGVVPCHCYRQLLVEQFYDISNLNSDGQTGFEFFDETFYSDSNDGQDSPRLQVLRIREKCLDFVNQFDQPDCPNLFFTGPTGVGKTFLSKSVALEILKKGHTVLYLPAPAMFDIIYRSKYKLNETDVPEDAYRYILDTELLIIDDLGTESPSAAKYTELLTLLNYRSAKNIKNPCKTILSTNIDPRDLHITYSERIESRILGEFDILNLLGDDIRLIKRLNRASG